MSVASTASKPSDPSRAQAQLAVDCRCELGEGIVWDEREQVLLWTDIHAARLWRHRLRDGATQSWRLPDRLGSFALCESGRLLLGLAKGLYLADLRDNETDERLATQLLVAINEHATLRLNDGRTDRRGNFVFGTLDEASPKRAIGRFYQYSARHGLRTLDLGGVAIPNSIAFAPDGASLYYCDTRRGEIMVCDYDAERAHTGAPRLFARVDAPASPDGATVDRDGHLWSAQWGAGRVVCYGRDGAIEHEVAVPTANPSCPAFGGARLDTLYLTTAREDLSSTQLEREPQAGGVFCAQIAGVVGLAEERFVGL
ncbi:SMP-30/gluconolactonase/LRE family protein [Rudaea cellulosilytica]|uniref:SMP-30/gluconolactonase/LRE family protein n=1 Tax=Rudaea cellulosilytica TaxID=540746 RepID=UPI000363F0F7|nr:SMP-30/gluconolactonase/LRE family protein [Rudaea cellulosilytica]